MGFHGTYYPILMGIAVRPNMSARVSWWNYESIRLPRLGSDPLIAVTLNAFWTCSIGGGSRAWSLNLKRDKDGIDIHRTGYFLRGIAYVLVTSRN